MEVSCAYIENKYIDNLNVPIKNVSETTKNILF